MIGLDEVRGAAQTLKEYKNGKRALENRIVANEQWWKLRHWGQMRGRGAEDQVEPVSAWLFNTILNKHADAMDNQPEPVVLPLYREPRESPVEPKRTDLSVPE